MIEQKAADTGRTRAYPLARQLYYNDSGREEGNIDPSSVDEVINKLADHVHNYCDDDTLMDTLYDADVYSYYSDSNRVNELRFLLNAYERSIERDRENIPFDVQEVVKNDSTDFTIAIEHVWPQTLSGAFPADLHDTIHENKHRLGILSLMTNKDNTGNDPFEDKKSDFDESKFRMLNEIFENNSWSVEHMNDRENRMLDVIK